jgi:hypothetical protein
VRANDCMPPEVDPRAIWPSWWFRKRSSHKVPTTVRPDEPRAAATTVHASVMARWDGCAPPGTNSEARSGIVEARS